MLCVSGPLLLGIDVLLIHEALCFFDSKITSTAPQVSGDYLYTAYIYQGNNPSFIYYIPNKACSRDCGVSSILPICRKFVGVLYKNREPIHK